MSFITTSTAIAVIFIAVAVEDIDRNGRRLPVVCIAMLLLQCCFFCFVSLLVVFVVVEVDCFHTKVLIELQ
jgi:hypothetical protein